MEARNDQNDDPLTHEYFLRVGGTVLDALGGEPSSESVGRTIENLVELFRALAVPPRKSVIGFWGELFVIANARDSSTLVQAWHRRPDERFDFALAKERLEVKTAVGRLRRHHFSLEQLQPVPGVETHIASLLVERSPAGPSVSELIESIRSEVASDAAQLLHVDAVTALILGSGWRQAMQERFDEHIAKSSLTFFDPTDIPKPDRLPPEVTEVHFVSDLSSCHPVSSDAYITGTGVLAAALPRSQRPAP